MAQSFFSFVKEYLPKYVEYFKVFDKGDIVFLSVEQTDNVDTIVVELEVGKGYGDNHYYRKDYVYEIDKLGLYDCVNVGWLCGYFEGEIVRKVMDAYEKYYGRKKRKVIVRIEQELD